MGCLPQPADKAWNLQHTPAIKRAVERELECLSAITFGGSVQAGSPGKRPVRTKSTVYFSAEGFYVALHRQQHFHARAGLQTWLTH